MFDLTGKTALVTGATGGLGDAIVRALHRAGARIAATGTRQEQLDLLAGELGERVVAIACDLGDREAVAALVPKVEEVLGPLDILVNNAGINRDALFVRISDKDWADVLEVNLGAAFRLSRAAVMSMMRRRTGRIISVTSVVGFTGNPGQANYAASKAGIVGMSKALAQEVAKRNITVNCVAPGIVETAMTRKLSEKQREAILAKVPADRLGVPEEVAAAVVFLASSEASYVTGQTIHVNGGMAMI
jgi:3-oxoacyl-[acyl-carrier protein] reductase